ncbi:hypothetical protein BDQ17DRAFT_1369970 [Cyathus striatus]|nr:hypothetical protein BDQ17DRAFT_1369970 [Cyathus striatus]
MGMLEPGRGRTVCVRQGCVSFSFRTLASTSPSSSPALVALLATVFGGAIRTRALPLKDGGVLMHYRVGLCHCDGDAFRLRVLLFLHQVFRPVFRHFQGRGKGGYFPSQGMRAEDKDIHLSNIYPSFSHPPSTRLQIPLSPLKHATYQGTRVSFCSSLRLIPHPKLKSLELYH